MDAPTIEGLFTRAPHAIEPEQSIGAAMKMMREKGIRHLPVVEDGKLLGIVSQRDLLLLLTFKSVDPDVDTVREAMTSEVFAISPGADLAAVAGRMAEQKYGCAVVVTGDRVKGIFTTVDALRALAKFARRHARAA